MRGRASGVAKGLFEVPEDIDAHNAEVARLFTHDATVARYSDTVIRC